ncbi:MAG: NADH-quinone oxidoreductase subunit A [Methanosarcinales archaeon]
MIYQTVLFQNALVVAGLVVVCLVIDGAIVLLSKLLPKYNPTPVKLQRFEAGNWPVGVPKSVLPMQYFGFLFMFMACEPIVVLLLLFSANPTDYAIVLLLLSLLILLPAVYVSYKSAVITGGETYG